MARFEIRLEDDQGNFRVTRLTAESKEQAQQIVEANERRLADFTLEDDEVDRLEKLEAKPGHERFGQLQAGDRASLISHRQAEPYKVVSVDKLPARGG